MLLLLLMLLSTLPPSFSLCIYSICIYNYLYVKYTCYHLLEESCTLSFSDSTKRDDPYWPSEFYGIYCLLFFFQLKYYTPQGITSPLLLCIFWEFFLSLSFSLSTSFSLFMGFTPMAWFLDFLLILCLLQTAVTLYNLEPIHDLHLVSMVKIFHLFLRL